MKKIIVSGCSNCPYLIIYNDGEDDGLDSICRGVCKHPSFNKELLAPQFAPNVFLGYDLNDKVNETIANGIPRWCPLPDDIRRD